MKEPTGDTTPNVPEARTHEGQPQGGQAICQQCYPNMVEVGGASRLLVVGAETTEEGEARWFLISEPCHNGDILITFEVTPQPDPLPEIWTEGVDISDDDPRWEAYDQWYETGREAMAGLSQGFDVRSAWLMAEDLREAGYDPYYHGEAEMWLYARIGAVIAEAENNTAS